MFAMVLTPNNRDSILITVLLLAIGDFFTLVPGTAAVFSILILRYVHTQSNITPLWTGMEGP